MSPRTVPSFVVTESIDIMFSQMFSALHPEMSGKKQVTKKASVDDDFSFMVCEKNKLFFTEDCSGSSGRRTQEFAV